MKQTTLVAVLAALSANSAAFAAIAEELKNGSGAAPASPETPAPSPDPEPEKPKRGRPPTKKEEPPPPADEKNEGGDDDDTADNPTTLRALYKPLIEAQRGAEVKKIIVKYAPGGIDQMDAKDYPKFRADIEALLM